jgi:hypothetical protein
MNKARRTTINGLTAAGHELNEEHLPLVAGGARRFGTKIRTDAVPNGDVEYDYYA